MKDWSSFHGRLTLVLLLLLSTPLAVQGREQCFDENAIRHLFEEIAALSQQCNRPAWPPATPKYHIDVSTKRIILGLQPVVLPNEKFTNWEADSLMELKKHYRGKTPEGSWLRQVVTMQGVVGSEVTKKSEFDYYPPAVDVPHLVSAMRKGEPIPMPPVDDPQIQLVRYPTTCSQEDQNTYDLIIGVYSCVTCAKNRRLARSTFMKPNLWNGMKVGFFFMMGMPAPANRNVVEFVGQKLAQPASLPDGVSQADATRQLLEEADKYKDILIGDYWDEFYAMTLRTIMGFRWTSLYCTIRSPLFIFVDQEYTIVPYQVERYVRSIPVESRPNHYAGWLFRKSEIFRAPLNVVSENPYAVSWDDLPWVHYPDYLSFVAIFLGREQLRDVTISMMFTKRFRLPDVFVGINFLRLKRVAQHIETMYFNTDKDGARSAMGAFTSTIVDLIDWNTGKAK